MAIFKIITTGGATHYVRASEDDVREAAWEHVKRKRAEGVPLSDISFAYVRVRLSKMPD